DGRQLPDRETGIGGRLRYSGASGMVLIRWEGARAPTVWTVPRPDVDPLDARRELAPRDLHVFGPATPEGFARWAGVGRPETRSAFEGLAGELTTVRTPIGKALILSRDEPAFRAPPRAPAPARLLPSGDTYYLLHGADREL